MRIIPRKRTIPARIHPPNAPIPPRRLHNRNLQSLRHPSRGSAPHPPRHRTGIFQPCSLLYVGGGADGAAADDRYDRGWVVLWYFRRVTCVLFAALHGGDEVGDGLREAKGG